jgi:dimethylargininase
VSPFGVRSMTAPLRRVAVRGLPSAADYAAAGWRGSPDVVRAAEEHAAFVATLESAGARVDLLPAAEGLADSCFTYDPVFVTGRGMVVLQQAKPARSAEPPVLAAELAALGVPEVGRLTGDARADGGDLYWLDEHTLAAGRGYRTNAAAHAQLRELLAGEGVDLVSFDLPHDRGPSSVLHLMSVVSAVADDLAVVHEPLAPVALLEALAERGVRRVPVDADEYDALGSNVLALSPGHVVAFGGAPRLAARLRDAGVEVTVLDCPQFALGDGGPTCLTRPLLRGGQA